MTEGMGDIPTITTIEPVGTPHELVNADMLEGASMDIKTRREMIPLFEYLGKEYAKPRGPEGGSKDLNSHKETFILREDGQIKLRNLSELQDMLKLAGFNADLLGVQSISNNANQTVNAVVQGVNEAELTTSGFERPVVSEGPHMIIAPYAYDNAGKLHVFRTVQYRTGSAGIDTPRGFLDAETLASGKHIYKVEGSEEKVKGNLGRIIKEEGGEKFLNIKKVDFLGAHIVNKSFVTSPSALFGVEIDYDTFTKLKNVISPEEAARRHNEREHEGMTDIIIDMTPEQYVHYKTDPNISKDLAADGPTDIIMMGHLLKNQKSETKSPVPPQAPPLEVNQPIVVAAKDAQPLQKIDTTPPLVPDKPSQSFDVNTPPTATNPPKNPTIKEMVRDVFNWKRK